MVWSVAGTAGVLAVARRATPKLRVATNFPWRAMAMAHPDTAGSDMGLNTCIETGKTGFVNPLAGRTTRSSTGVESEIG